MLETRLPAVSPRELSPRPLPRPAAPAADRAARRLGSVPRPGLDVRESHESAARARVAARQTARGRMARSEARLLAFAVAGTALMCAVLVIYLAAYAHVSQLGLDQARARVQLRQAQQENDLLQAQLARLQSPARIVTAAQALGMTASPQPATYLSARDTAAQMADRGNSQDFQGTNGGTSADGGTASAFDH